MRTTDDALDETSRKLLSDIEALKELEQRKRQTGRSSGEFHELAAEVEAQARHVFDVADLELRQGHEDSPIPAEREHRRPADWTDGDH